MSPASLSGEDDDEPCTSDTPVAAMLSLFSLSVCAAFGSPARLGKATAEPRMTEPKTGGELSHFPSLSLKIHQPLAKNRSVRRKGSRTGAATDSSTTLIAVGGVGRHPNNA